MAQQINNMPLIDDLLKKVEGVVLNPRRWLKTPNDQLGGRKPIELINGSDEERLQVFNLVRAIEHGMFT